MLSDQHLCLRMRPQVQVAVFLKKLYYNITKKDAHAYSNSAQGRRGSIMLAILPALLCILHLRPGAKVSLTVQRGRLVVEPQVLV